jgi:uncharacterized YccA/Bax inhibitor family protein
MWNSSNPVLNHTDSFDQVYGRDMFATRSNESTLQGVVNKTAILVGICTACGCVGYALFQSNPSALWISSIASLIVGLGIAFFLCGKPQAAPIFAPIYAIVEGVFLGAFTGVADSILASRGLSVAGGVGVQAFVVTISVMVAMLALYKARIIQPTERLKAVISVATVGIILAYGVSFVLSLFGFSMPFISFGSAVNDHGWRGLIGLGINLLILGIGALTLVIDFKRAEDAVASGAPKYMEWYCGFGLLVTLAWIYYEAVKLIVRVAVVLGNRK